MMETRFALVVLLGVFLVASPRPASAGEAAPGTKSETRAFLCSFLGAAVPIGAGALVASTRDPWEGNGAAPALVIGGCLVGPSLGHFYAGRPGHALVGIGIRSAALVGAAFAVGSSWENENTGSDILAAASLVVGAGSMIFDVAEAPHSARAHNAKALKPRACVAPAMVGRDRALGLRVDCGF